MIVARAKPIFWVIAHMLSSPLLVFVGSVWMTRISLEENPAIWGDPTETVLLSAVGDIMIQRNLRKFAEQNGGYEVLFRYVQPTLKRNNIVFGNLESPVAPKTGKPQVGYQFNMPLDALDSLRKAGFSVLSLANNHLHDQGIDGVKETIENLKAAGLSYVGVRTAPESPPRLDLTINGIKFTLLAYTMLTNRPVSPHEFPRVALWDKASSLDEIAEARRASDFVIVSLHWGKEYSVNPGVKQERAASAICEAGADLILGHHPHTLQPIRKLKMADGRFCIVVFSLGNFVSNMSRNYSEGSPLALGDPRDSIILQALFRKGRTPQITFVPLWMVNSTDFKGIVPLEKLCNEAAVSKREDSIFPQTLNLVRLRAVRSAQILREGETALAVPSPCITAISAHLRDEPRKLTFP